MTDTPKMPTEGGVYLRDKNGALRSTEKPTEIRDPMGQVPAPDAPAQPEPAAPPQTGKEG